MDQVRSDFKKTPRCLCLFTLSIQILLNSNGGELFSALLEKITSLDFLGLNVTCHLSAQDDIFSKSLFKILDVSVGSIPVAKRVVSSAKT